MAPPRKYHSEEERRQARSDKARLKRESMTPEERQKTLDKKRDYRNRMKQEMNEAERKEYRRKKNESSKKRRSMMTPEEHEECRRKEKESERKRKEKQKQAGIRLKRRRRANSKLKLANMTEEEKRIQREKDKHRRYFLKQARLAEMTKEEREEYDRKCTESRRKMKLGMTEEQKKEAKQKHYFYEQARLARMTPEEREERTRNKADWHRRWRETLTGEKLERYKESLRRSAKKFIKSDKFKSSKMYQKMLEYQRRRTATETPEERQKMLRKYKINQAVRKLRAVLENEGEPLEEIERKAKELRERMWAEPLPLPEGISNCLIRPRQRGRPRQQVNPTPPEKPPRDSSMAGETPPEKISNFATRETTSPKQETNPSPLLANESVESSMSNFPTEAMSPQHSPTVTFQGNDEYSCRGDDDDDDYAFASEEYVKLDEESIETHESPQEGGYPVIFSITPVVDVNCPHCSSHFLQKSDLTAHIISEHPKKCWKCPMCKQVMISPAELKEHFKSDCQHASRIPLTALSSSKEISNTKSGGCGSDNMFSCMKCDPLSPDSERTFRTSEILKEHVKSKHPESYWPCSKCDILKYSERALRTHEKVCRSQKKI